MHQSGTSWTKRLFRHQIEQDGHFVSSLDTSTVKILWKMGIFYYDISIINIYIHLKSST